MKGSRQEHVRVLEQLHLLEATSGGQSQNRYLKIIP